MHTTRRKNVAKSAPNRRYWVAVRYYGAKRRLQTYPDDIAANVVRTKLRVPYTKDQLDAGLEMFAVRKDADYALMELN